MIKCTLSDEITGEDYGNYTTFYIHIPGTLILCNPKTKTYEETLLTGTSLVETEAYDPRQKLYLFKTHLPHLLPYTIDNKEYMAASSTWSLTTYFQTLRLIPSKLFLTFCMREATLTCFLRNQFDA